MDKLDVRGLADMALTLLDASDLAQTLDRVVKGARQSLDCDDAGVMLVSGHGRVEVAVATDSRVREADHLQQELGEGPGLQAIWSRSSFIVSDTAAEGRWPSWRARAAGLGLHSVLSVHLFTPRATLGALNLYGVKPAAFSQDTLDVADVFGLHASVALAVAREEDGLRHAIAARHAIGQAQGILMERYGLDGDRAFAVLQRYSRNNNVKLRVVAQQIVGTGRLPGVPAENEP